MKNRILISVFSLLLVVPEVLAQSSRGSSVKAGKYGIVQEIWEGVSGNQVANLANNNKYKKEQASRTVVLDSLSAESLGENYGARYRGLFIPPASGDYSFWLAGDDSATLYFSSDESPDNVKEIASIDHYTGKDHFESRGKSEPITLTAGKKYYFSLLHKQAGGNDYISMAWEGPGHKRDILKSKYVALPVDGKLNEAIKQTVEKENKSKVLVKSLLSKKAGDVQPMLEKLSDDDRQLLVFATKDVLNKAAKLPADEKQAFLKPYYRAAQGVTASPQEPVKNPVAKNLLYIEDAYISSLSDGQIKKMGAHRLASSLGKIPQGAKPETVTVMLDSHPEKHRGEMVSTGVYLLPGVPAKVTIPKEYAGSNLSIQVGHHIGPGGKDLVSAPHSTRHFPLKGETTEIVSPHGGIVLLNVPKELGLKGAPFKFENIIKAPRFVLGKTTDEEWKSIRNNPAPWGELVSEYLTLLVSSESLQKLDNPTELMEWWNENNRIHEDFYAYYPKIAFRMHESLYAREGVSYWPLEWNIGNTVRLLDINAVKKMHNGLYLHEHGHHADFGDMEIGNASESTCNWAGYYMRQKSHFAWKDSHAAHLNSLLDPENKTHNEIKEPGWYDRKDKGTHHWSYMITSMMIGYAEDFGWDAVRTVLHRIRDGNDPMYQWEFTGKNRSSQAKIDRYLIGMSEAVKRDVRPYFAHLKVLPSDGAAKYLDQLNLTKWDLSYMPVPEDLAAKAGEKLSLTELQNGAKSMAGPVKVEWNEKTEHGKVVVNSQGNAVYVADKGYSGTDKIGYSLVNSVSKSPVKYVTVKVK